MSTTTQKTLNKLILLVFIYNFPTSLYSSKPPCKPNRLNQKITQAQLFKNTPYKIGETSTFDISWAGLYAGIGKIAVQKPVKHNNFWHRVFTINANTGSWFKFIFVAKYIMKSISTKNYAVDHFYMHQNEGSLFGTPFIQTKTLNFNHQGCYVDEKIERKGRDLRTEKNTIVPGVIDTVGILFKMRSESYKIGNTYKTQLYSSGENWWLNAYPIKYETINVPAGTFKTVKLKLETFIGKELQQKGKVFVWIATEHSSKPIVQVQGEIKIGSVWLKLKSFHER